MTISLSTVSTALSTVSTVLKASEVIYEAGAKLIQVAENAYISTLGSGASKKAAVMAGLKAFVKQIGENWEELKDELSDWIDMVVQSWNSLKALFVVSDVAAETDSSTHLVADATA